MKETVWVTPVLSCFLLGLYISWSDFKGILR